MTTLDYFLFDNRTWAPGIGHDWGIKAATGVLATRSDLRSMFTRYCAALRSDQGYLDGFGQALGGIRSRSGGGYLLCVTLETVDHFGRPSWAAYGLWCPTVATLESVLRGDAVGSVNTILGADPPPASMTLKSSGLSLRPRRRRRDVTVAFQAFDRRTTIAEVISLLLGAIRGNTPLPDILGITASSQLPLLGQTYSIVYCHPLDERAERVFARHRTVVEPLEDVADEAPEVMAQPTGRPKFSRSPLNHYGTWLGIAVAAVMLLVWAQAATSPPVPSEAVPSVCTQIHEIQRLDPEALRRSPAFADKKANAAVVTLLEARERIAGAECVDELAPATTASIEIGVNACAAVQHLYDSEPEIHQWCDAMKNLESAAFSFRNTANHQSGDLKVEGDAERTTS